MVRTAPMMGWIWQPNAATISVTSASCCGVSRFDLGRIMTGRWGPPSCAKAPARSMPNSEGANELLRQRSLRREGEGGAADRVVERDFERVQEQPSGAHGLRERAVGRKVAVGLVPDNRQSP